MISVVTRFDDDDPLFGQAWSLCNRSFQPLTRLAVQRHTLHMDEFVKLMRDTYIDKYLHLEDGRLTGLALFTRNLWHVDLISTTFFAESWPEEFEARRIWYVLFVCTEDGSRTAFRELINAMFTAAGPGGRVVMDSCLFVDTMRGMPSAAEKMVRRWDPGMRLEELDRQTYRMFTLSGAAGADPVVEPAPDRAD
jgi:hypothetical protein